MKTDSSCRLDLKPSLRGLAALCSPSRTNTGCWKRVCAGQTLPWIATLETSALSEGIVCPTEHSKELPSEQQARGKWGYLSASYRRHVSKSSPQIWCSSSGSSLWQRQGAYRGAWNPQRQRQKGPRPYCP